MSRSGLVSRHDEADLALAVDGEHRYLHRVETRERSDENHRFEPRGQLPSDPSAGPHTPRVQSRRDLLDARTILSERQAFVSFVNREQRVRRPFGAKRNQRPERSFVDHGRERATLAHGFERGTT